MKKKSLMVVLSALLVLFLCPTKFAFAVNKSNNFSEHVNNILNSMTLQEKICQTFMVDFQYWGDPKQNVNVLNQDIKDILNKYKFGSFILYDANLGNTTDTFNLVKDIQAASPKIPMLIATDQEGGTLNRLPYGCSLPGNMAVGATFDEENAYEIGNIIGSELHSLAINTTLAPDIDVNSNANNPIIGVRSFGDDPELVSLNGSSLIEGLNDNYTIGCGKHFPGHGDTGTDSHTSLPIVDKSWNELLNREIVPFKNLIDNDSLDMVMTAHILYPQVDSSKIYSEKTQQEESRPATLSKEILTNKLRGELGFDGVICTDGMSMKGITDFYNMNQAIVESLAAGSDIVCKPLATEFDTSPLNKEDYCKQMDEIILYVENAIKSGKTLTESQLDEKVGRILQLKENHGILDYDPAEYSLQKALDTVGGKVNRAAEEQVTAKSVTTIKNENNTLPVQLNDNSKVLFVCHTTASSLKPEAEVALGWNKAKAQGLIPQGAQANVYTISKDDFKIEGNFKQAIDNADIVINLSNVWASNLMAYKSWESAGVQNAVEYCKNNNKKSIVISVNIPYDVQLYPNADAILAVYNSKGCKLAFDEVIKNKITNPDIAFGPNIVAGVDAIFGAFPTTGKLPVNIPKYDADAEKYTDEIVFNRGYGLTNTIEKATVKLEYDSIEYDGTEKCPKVNLSLGNNKELVQNKDFKVSYSNNIEPGQGIVHIDGIGAYTGAIDKTFEIIKKDVPPVPPTPSDDTNINPGTVDNPDYSVATGDCLYIYVLIASIVLASSICLLFMRKNDKI